MHENKHDSNPPQNSSGKENLRHTSRPLPTAEAFDKRGPVPFRSIAYNQTIIEINALEDAIKALSTSKL